ncbi:stealth family protein [Roseateles oligotrophus]|uniref:Capsular polysaccharide phosphotransferase SacB n=1 Tax=Roseateles oligotrophus TaxID=1769250 RepID=A0ABT2YF15_9BURK|nr:stealth family protein [Roseateles oligotrophus]MCV2368640.1 Stealth CR1 domain-containing protein [Roseateles oligotrophus]
MPSPLGSAESVDIVYLWVDGSDPVWRSKRHRAAARLCVGRRDEMAVYGNVEGRFRDNDELRYNLRALERYFPAHGHVYLLTDGQRPAWLQESDRITVIDHGELMPADALPTFDSGHIESYVHRIPGLSERFLYLNDDVFFGSPVRLDDWFWADGIYTAWSDEALVSDEPMRADATALDNACRLSHHWLRSSASPPVAEYSPTFRTFAHAPRPMLRSVMFELERLAPELFGSVRSTVFRVWNKPTIVSDFVMRWSLSRGRAKLRGYSHLFLATGAAHEDAEAQAALQALVASEGQLDFFCLNDTTDDASADDPRLLRVRAALQQMFTAPSSFERTALPV